MRRLEQGAYPVDEDGLYELDDLKRDLQTDGDQVVEQDDERQEVIAEVAGWEITCRYKQGMDGWPL